MSETSSSIIDKSTIKKGPNATWEKEQRPARWDDLLASRLGTFYRGRSTSASGFMELIISIRFTREFPEFCLVLHVVLLGPLQLVQLLVLC